MIFKVAVPKTISRRNTSGVVRTSNKIVRAKVFEDEEGFKVAINMKNDPHYPDLWILPFSERSYELKGRINVFSRTVDEKGNRTRFVRNESHAKFMPGLPEQYIPFAPNWIVTGYIVKENGITKFDFKDIVTIDGYNTFVYEEEEE